LSSAWIGPGYQSYRILPYKRQREREIGSYDAVIDTRFDVMVAQNFTKHYSERGLQIVNIPIEPIEHNTLYSDLINYDVFQEPNVNLPRPSDHWFIMSSNMYQNFTERFIRKEKYSCHEEFYLICQEENWKLEQAKWAKTMITRPNMIDYIVDPYNFFEIEKIPKIKKGLHEINHEWMEMSIEDRIQMCRNKGIDPIDYAFQNEVLSAYAEGVEKPL
jgi:hypothetical protein